MEVTHQSQCNFGTAKNILLYGDSQQRGLARLKGFSLRTEGFQTSRFSRCECGRSRIHCGESLMSLREVAMLYERIMATRRSTGRPRDHNTYVASIFIGRDIQPPPPKPSCRSKRRVLLVQVMPDWLPDRRCSSTVRFPSSFSFISSRLLLRVRPRKRTYVYEQCDFNKGAFSKSQQTSAIEPP